jgi:RHH-type proline utilization regulon transcriptional repressor/proline dehydrogenase/delta 1-pyrroline-5-carboxylate dehydrogenase
MALHNQLPPTVRAAIDLEAVSASSNFDAALFHGDPKTALQTAAWLAQRPGAIVSLTVMSPGSDAIPLARLVSERSISINTAAAGGNTSLMALA